MLRCLRRFPIALVATLGACSDDPALPIEPQPDLYSVSGSVTGLTGSGLVLTNNGGDALTVAADGTFTFATQLAVGVSYDVRVQQHPTQPMQTCTVANGSGVITNTALTTIVVSCATLSFPLTGTVTGLGGAGLTLSTGSQTLVVDTESFVFPEPLLDGSAYSVEVASQPAGPHQTCTLTNASGVVHGGASSIAVTCATNTYHVSVTVTGPTHGLTLVNNGQFVTAREGDHTLSFTGQLDGTPYAVTLQRNAYNGLCTVSPNGGVIDGADVTSIVVNCARFDLDAAPLSHTATLTWADIGARSYLVSWSTSWACAAGETNVCDDIEYAEAVTSPFTIHGLKNDVGYFVSVSAGFDDVAGTIAVAEVNTSALAFSGDIYASKLEDDGTVRVAGYFDNVGVEANGAVLLRGPVGRPAANAPEIFNSAGSVIADNNGGWYVSGALTVDYDRPNWSVVHLRPDLTVDPTFVSPVINQIIEAMALDDVQLYIGGGFENVSGLPRSRLAALDRFDGSLTEWDPGITAGVDAFYTVRTIAVSDTTVYAAGSFTSVRGTARAGVAAWDNSTAALLPWAPAAQRGAISELAMRDEEVFACGAYSAGGVLTGYTVALDPVSAALTWEVPAGFHMALTDGHLYAGTRTSAGVSNVVAFDTQSHTQEWSAPLDSSPSPIIATDGTSVYLAGGFTTLETQSRNGLAALDAATGALTAWNPAPLRSYIHRLAADAGSVYVVGDVIGYNQQRRAGLATVLPSGELSGQAGSAFEEHPGWETVSAAAPNGSVYAVVVHDGVLYVGGDFTQIGGEARANLAALDEASGTVLPWAPNPNDSVVALAVTGDTVYLSGSFTTIGGTSHSALAAVHRVTGLATSWDPHSDRPVSNITAVEGHVFVAGLLLQFAGAHAGNVARLDATSGAVLRSLMMEGDGPLQVVSTGTKVTVTGDFRIMGDHYRENFAEIDAATGIVLP